MSVVESGPEVGCMIDGQLHLSYEEVEDLTIRAVDLLRDPGSIETIIGISRGGLEPTSALSRYLDIKSVGVISMESYEGDKQVGSPRIIGLPDPELVEGKKTLITDDVWDTGNSIVTAVPIIENMNPAGLFVVTTAFKPSRNMHKPRKPDAYGLETDEWIVFPWERIKKRQE